MKQKITVLLEVKNFFEYIFGGTSLYFYKYSGVPPMLTYLMEPDCISTISLVDFLIFRNGFRLS